MTTKLGQVLDFKMGDYEREQQRRSIKVDNKKMVFATGIPLRYQRMVMTRLNDEGDPIRVMTHDHALHTAWEEGKTMVLMLGKPKTGKTVTCSRWLAPYTEGQFLMAWDIGGLSANYAPDRQQWVKWVRSKQMVIDELDKVPSKNRDRLHQFLHERHAKGHKTVCTANRYQMPQWLLRRFDVIIHCLELA